MEQLFLAGIDQIFAQFLHQHAQNIALNSATASAFTHFNTLFSPCLIYKTADTLTNIT
jgi:hypothetical protein